MRALPFFLAGTGWCSLGFLVLAGCPKKEAEPLSPPGALTIMHTNDLHGHYLPERAEWLPGEPEIGGMVRLEQEVRDIRTLRGASNTLLLDGGDILTGTPLTAISEEGAYGTPMLRFMEAVGYDAWVVGNHEFDRGLPNLTALSAKSTFAMLSANLRAKDRTSPLLPQQEFSRVFTVNDLKVGVIGGTTDQLKSLVSPSDWARMGVIGVADAIKAEAARLEPETDLLIALTHVGVEGDKALAAAVPALDIIVGGHSHTPLREPVRVGQTVIVQAGSYGRQLGVLDVQVEDDAVVSSQYKLRDLTPESTSLTPNTTLQALADHYRTNIDAVYGEVLGKAKQRLEKDYHHESALGRWISDALRHAAHTDLGIYNGGGLRSEIVAGPVTRRHLFECFPFENAVTTFTMRGDQLTGILLRNLSAEASEARGFLPISGVTWTWRINAGAPELLTAEVGGKPLDLMAVYSVATTSYIVEQWEKHLGFQPADIQRLPINDFEAAVEYAREAGFDDRVGRRGVRAE